MLREKKNESFRKKALANISKSDREFILYVYKR